MTLFITSDTHFGHKNILKFCPNTRQGVDAEDMTWRLIDAFNRRVKPTDELLFLGDLSFADADSTVKYLRAINCRNKRIVLGNHDKVLQSYGVAAEFTSIEHYRIVKENGHKFVCFHFPMREWDSMQRGSFHLYGHVHGDLRHEDPLWGRSMDVGIDARPDNLMEPWALSEIFEKLKDKPILSHHSKHVD